MLTVSSPPQSGKDDKESGSCGVVDPRRQNGHKGHRESKDQESADGEKRKSSESYAPSIELVSRPLARHLWFLGFPLRQRVEYLLCIVVPFVLRYFAILDSRDDVIQSTETRQVVIIL